MTTIGIAARAGFRAAKQAKSNTRTHAADLTVFRRIAAKVADSALIIAGLGALTTAAVLFNLELGLVAAGLSLFVLDFELSS